MTEKETLAFLKDMGVQPFEWSKWQPHHPLMFVLPQATKSDYGPFSDLPLSQRPSLARVDDPTNLYSPIPERKSASGKTEYALENKGGQVDYFTIDPQTKKITTVRTTNNIKINPPYYVTEDALFMPYDDLFPKSGK